MNSRRRISALQRFVGKPIGIRGALERAAMALVAAPGRPSLHVRFGIVAGLAKVKNRDSPAMIRAREAVW
jgi:hypothetical protein